MKVTVSILSLMICSSILFSQIDNRALYNDVKVGEKDSSKFYVAFTNRNILIDNEYFLNIATGYTLFCSEVNTNVGYNINKYARVEGGVFLRKDYGNPNYLSIVAPTVSFKLHKNGYSFIFGNLEGCLSHQLIQPVFNYERIVTNPLENGAQFKIDKKKVWLDLWIDWEQQEYQNVNYKEHIGSGLSSKFELFNHNDVFKIILPVQAFVFHHGGQIDTNQTPLLTLMNYATGLTFDWDLSKKGKFITNIRSDNYIVGFTNGSTQHNVFPYYTSFNSSTYNNLNYFPTSINNGNGTYLNLTVTSKYNVSLMASYWQGHNFVAGHGGDLYQSVSSIAGYNYMETNRSLVFLRALYMKELFPNLYLDIRFEPYYDLNLTRLEYCYSAFVTYRKTFAIRKPTAM
jgi:hypothetical protein